MPGPKVMVYRFRMYDIASDEFRTSTRFATLNALGNIRGAEVLGRGINVDASDVGGDIDGMTVRDYRPPSP